MPLSILDKYANALANEFVLQFFANPSPPPYFLDSMNYIAAKLICE